jgi:hypothetical protein
MICIFLVVICDLNIEVFFSSYFYRITAYRIGKVLIQLITRNYAIMLCWYEMKRLGRGISIMFSINIISIDYCLRIKKK